MKNAIIQWYETYEDEAQKNTYLECTYKTFIGGQTVEVSFQSDQPVGSSIIHWNISLVIYNKRKDIKELYHTAAITGKIGVKGLLFAKRAVQDFETYLKTSPYHNQKKHYLFATWLDNRRRDVYEYGLSKLGFEYSRYKGKKCLEKIVRGEH